MYQYSKRLLRFAVLLAVVTTAVFISACSEDPVEVAPSGKLPVPTNGLIAFYPFNGDALDASGNDNNGSLLGPDTVTTYLTIRHNTTDRLSLPFTIFEGMGDFTVSAWGRISALQTNHTLLSGARGGMDNAVLLLFNPNDDLWVFNVNGVGPHFGPSATFSDTEWHHIVVSRRGSIARLYVDNNEIGDGMAVSEAAINLDPGGLIIGQDQDSVGGGFQIQQAWSGDIDNLRIYNRALNVNEIKALYQESHGGG